jgi:STE24 endopeptidase
MASAVLPAFLAFFLLRLAVEGALLLLNLRHAAASGAAVPDPLRGRVSEETALRSLGYTLARGRLALVSLAWGAATTLTLLLSGVLPWLEGWLAGRGLAGAHRFAAFLLLVSAATSLAALPLSLYGTFLLEARFGFNRTTWRTWAADQLKGLAVGLALGVPLLYATWFFASATGSLWWLWLWAFLAAVQALLVWIYPALIAPIFHRFAPLSEGELRDRLEALSRDAGFRTSGLFVMDASRRSSHSNAWFMGIVRPRIVLFDTLLSAMTVDEAAAVLAHEIGHFRLRHVRKRLAAGLFSSLLGLWVLSRLVAWTPFFEAFGFAGPSWEAALAIVALGGGAFTFFLVPLSSWISRRQEHAADRYAVAHSRSPEALKGALVKLNGENLSNLHPHPWYSRWHYGHPTLLERLAAIDAAAAGSA